MCAQPRLWSAWTSAQSDQSLLCSQWVAKVPSFLHADSEHWSVWVDAQADLSLCWTQMPLCRFCHDEAYMTYILLKQWKIIVIIDVSCVTAYQGTTFQNRQLHVLFLLTIKHILAMWQVGGRYQRLFEPEDHWSCIANLSAEDMLKSADIAAKKFKNILLISTKVNEWPWPLVFIKLHALILVNCIYQLLYHRLK